MPIKICLVAGARPNFMKVAPLMREFQRWPDVDTFLVHTGQHYDAEMSDHFFDDLELPKPDVDLGVGSGSHAEQTARIMMAFEKVLLEEQPNIVVVVGDVNSTLACALTTAKFTYSQGRRSKVAHVEAGLRSFDRTMPEETNRIVTDMLSDILFTTSRDAGDNLRREGIQNEKVFFVGNVMIDTLLAYREKAKRRSILNQLGLVDGAPHGLKPYAVCTLHRPSNVDEKGTLLGILDALCEVGKKIPIIYPVHPRTQQRFQSLGVSRDLNFSRSTEPIDSKKSITCVEPLRYLDFLQLMANARIVLTDSGGIQEETTILGIPCVTIRENTERPITIQEGTNILAGIKKEGILKAASQALNDPTRERRIPEKWDGRAAGRIVQVLLSGKVNG